MAAKTGMKRKHVSHDLAFKMKVLEEVDRKEMKKSEICKKFSIANSTLSTFIKDRAKIEAAYSSHAYQPNRKRMRTCVGNRETLEEALFQWFTQARTLNLPISGPILCEKAVAIAEELGVEGFMPNPGWLTRFKQRKGIVFKTICGESASVPQETVDRWSEETLPRILKDYSPRDVYNADETGLFYRCIPNKTLSLKGDTCSGGKNSKERVTLLLCANMSGDDKLPLLIIGKSQKPRCFKNVKTLPVTYRANAKSWMTGQLFQEWLTSINEKFRKEDRHVLLFIDNCPAHPTVELSNVRLVFFPPNTTSKLQPCDQGIIANFKHYYRQLVLQKIIIAFDSDSDRMQGKRNVSEVFSFTLLDALKTARTAWGCVTEKTVQNCFRHAGFLQAGACGGGDTEDATDDSLDEEDRARLRDCFQRVSNLLDTGNSTADDFLSVDSEVCTTAEMTVTEIVKAHCQPSQSDDEEEEDSDKDPPPPPTRQEALAAINTLSAFVLSRDNSLAVLDDVTRIEQFVVHSKVTKQTTLQDFFKSV